jgi:hypothetical protein
VIWKKVIIIIIIIFISVYSGSKCPSLPDTAGVRVLPCNCSNSSCFLLLVKTLRQRDVFRLLTACTDSDIFRKSVIYLKQILR